MKSNKGMPEALEAQLGAKDVMLGSCSPPPCSWIKALAQPEDQASVHAGMRQCEWLGSFHCVNGLEAEADACWLYLVIACGCNPKAT